MPSSLPGRSGKLKWLFFILLLITIGFTLLMRSLLFPLDSGDIIHYEMARTPDRAAALIQEWRSDGKYAMAIRSIQADYFFILLYTLTLSVGAPLFSRLSGNELFRHTGKFFSVLV